MSLPRCQFTHWWSVFVDMAEKSGLEGNIEIPLIEPASQSFKQRCVLLCILLVNVQHLEPMTSFACYWLIAFPGNLTFGPRSICAVRSQLLWVTALTSKKIVTGLLLIGTFFASLHFRLKGFTSAQLYVRMQNILTKFSRLCSNYFQRFCLWILN